MNNIVGLMTIVSLENEVATLIASDIHSALSIYHNNALSSYVCTFD